mmetsp:Transcript_11655/g.13858  ORF Transcript_11655/g.13858 Transcript_11655/m.13858 type:complete len:365 (+) Transcript_11655:333-1427(+)|eukprot:CAMPEP_0197845726 /NCGR_PEP_ID=MMETSP1438-20131217/2621_1 /TAXON_ID=1461541 /ORGANISM="Pterosperma sp., Strain CCMP1384" /LENGTH=364 /DNA_ID=CAMNT_0043457131 /DNA_START=132 /DNA_END=1226 /DNA_ORIENTATION=+
MGAETDNNKSSYATKFCSVVALTLLGAAIALLTHGSKVDGKYEFDTMTVQMFSEFLKCTISAFMLSLEYAYKAELPVVTLDKIRMLKASFPAALYFITNNVNFLILRELSPVAFQILANMKIIITAVVFRLMMKADIKPLQWRMVLVLSAASIISQLGACNGSYGFQGSLLGYSLKLMNCTFTALATVYNEKFMKENNDSIHFQNLQLYTWGLFFGTTATIQRYHWEAFDIQVVTSGYNGWVVVLILVYALTGVATAAVVKYIDNMARIFASQGSMFIVAIISIIFYDEPLRLDMIFGMIVAACAVEIYNRHEHFCPVRPPLSLPSVDASITSQQSKPITPKEKEKLTSPGPKEVVFSAEKSEV